MGNCNIYLRRVLYEKRLIKLLLIAIVVIATCFRYNKISRTDVESRFYDFYYNMEENVIDVLAIGSSHIYCSLNPVQMYNDYGISAYNLAEGSQAIWFSYFYLKEALKTQKPEVVIIDTYTMYCEEDDVFDEKIQGNLLCLNISKNKYDALKTSGAEDWLQILLRFPITHGMYNSITKNNYVFSDECTLGYYFSADKEVFHEVEDVSNVKESSPVTAKAEEYLRKTIELCQENGINIVIFNAPWPSISEEIQSKYNYVGKIADEYSVPYLNLCSNMDEVGLDWENDAFDEGAFLLSNK